MEYRDWKNRLSDELAHWEWAVRDRIEDMNFRLDAKSPIQDFIKPYIKFNTKILDVGCGVITSLGKIMEGQDGLYQPFKLDITAVDILADEYNELLDKHGLTPPIKTIKGSYETILQQFGENSFDLVHTRNSLDHCHNPIEAINAMLEVCGNEGHVFIQVYENEAQRNKNQGLHQWDFSIINDRLFLNGMSIFEIFRYKTAKLEKSIGEDGLTTITWVIKKELLND